jgi:hypothetical protein
VSFRTQLVEVTRRLGARVAALRPFTVVFAAWIFVVVYAFPGYMNWDASEQETQARAGEFWDGHPPLMAFMWRLAERLAHGPFLMLLLQTSLFAWGLFAAFRLRFLPRTAAWLAAALLLFPPVLTPMAVVWKDAQMAGFLLAGIMLTLQPSRRARVAGIALLFLGVGVRHNAPFALPGLCMFAVATWGVRRNLVVIAAAMGLALALTAGAMFVNAKLILGRENTWIRTIAMHDILGTVCMSDPMSDAEVRDLLTGVPLLIDGDLQQKFCAKYDPRVWFQVSFGDGAPFSQRPWAKERSARKHAWIRALREHPLAYLHHRWRVFAEVIGLTTNPPWEPACQEFGANHDQMQALGEAHTLSWFQIEVGKVAQWFAAKTPAYRPWAYAVIGLILLGFALVRRDGWLAALLTSGMLYEASYFIGAPSPDFRYSHWLVTCVCIAAITVCGERLRAGFARLRAPD